MRKKQLIVINIVSLLTVTLYGCSQNKSTTTADEPSITILEPTQSVPSCSVTEEPVISKTVSGDSDSDPQFENSEEYSLDGDLKPEELKLGIDSIEKRKALANEMGAEAYWIGALTAGNYIQTQTCADSPVKDTIEQAYPDYSATVVQLTSNYDGHIIPADYALADHNEDNDTIIFVHGAGENRRNFNALCKFYLALGYNVLAYDQRSSGENNAPFCTFGYLEQYDLKQYVEFIDNKISTDKKILVYARSQGGCTVCRILGSDYGNNKIDGAILDCPLTSMRQIVEPHCIDYINANDLDYYFECGDKVLSYFIDGFTMAGAEMTEYMKNTTVPTLVLTSRKDNVVDKDMPISVYNAIPGTNKQLYISDTAWHCGILATEPDNYRNTVTKFLNNYIN